MWECGLKPKHACTNGKYPVTPYVGVWIETTVPAKRLSLYTVTPYVGVWIETERGIRWHCRRKVTPYVGVWIETKRIEALELSIASLLMWECGLKR